MRILSSVIDTVTLWKLKAVNNNKHSVSASYLLVNTPDHDMWNLYIIAQITLLSLTYIWCRVGLAGICCSSFGSGVNSCQIYTEVGRELNKFWWYFVVISNWQQTMIMTDKEIICVYRWGVLCADWSKGPTYIRCTHASTGMLFLWTTVYPKGLLGATN